MYYHLCVSPCWGTNCMRAGFSVPTCCCSLAFSVWYRVRPLWLNSWTKHFRSHILKTSQWRVLMILAGIAWSVATRVGLHEKTKSLCCPGTGWEVGGIGKRQKKTVSAAKNGWQWPRIPRIGGGNLHLFYTSLWLWTNCFMSSSLPLANLEELYTFLLGLWWEWTNECMFKRAWSSTEHKVTPSAEPTNYYKGNENLIK